MSIGSSGDTAFNSAPLGLVVLACCGHRSLPRRCLLCCSTVWYRVIYTLVYVFLGRNCVTHQSLFLVSPPPPCPCLIRHHGFANSFFLLDCPQTLQRRPGRQFEIFGFEKATSFSFLYNANSLLLHPYFSTTSTTTVCIRGRTTAYG